MQIYKSYPRAILLLSIAALFFLGCEQDSSNQAITSPEDLSLPPLGKNTSSSIMPIALARADNPRDFVPDFMGETVTIKGVITSPNFTDSPIFDVTNALHFIQDNSAGIQLFAHFLISPPVLEMGDKVVVTGVIKQFKGNTQIELQSANDLQIVGTKSIRRPKKIHAAHLADHVGERIEGQLVLLENVKIVDGQFDGRGLVRVVDSKGETAIVFIDRDTDIIGSPTPNGWFNVTGVVNQYTFDTPADNGYQIVPRGLFDID